jgi:hypothetical protein
VAAAHVAAWAAEVRKHLVLGASLFEGVGKDGAPGRVQVSFREEPLVVGGAGQLHDRPGGRGAQGRPRAERLAEQVAR